MSSIDGERTHSLPDLVGGGLQVCDDLPVRVRAARWRCRGLADPGRQGCLLVPGDGPREGEQRADRIWCLRR